MEHGGSYPIQGKKRRTCCLIAALCAVVFLFAVFLAVALSRADQSSSSFKSKVISRCEQFVNSSKNSSGHDCQRIWSVFERAYVGQDPCSVPMEAYSPLISTVTQQPACNRMLFWSKTKEVVHKLTERKACFVTLEDTLLGSLMDGLTWCSKAGSAETFTEAECPGWTECDANPVRSFWNTASAAFADAACGNVTVMLDGSRATPFSPTSIFASIEVKRFNPNRMNSLTVVLVTKENNITTCSNPSLANLQSQLDPKLTYICKEVPMSQIKACISNPDAPCGPCW